MTDIPKATRLVIYERADECCEKCYGSARGGSVHHRSARRMGGSKDPAKNLPSNLLLLCGSGTTGCHEEIERKAEQHYDDGFLVHSWDDPHLIPIPHRFYGRVWLADDGTYLLDPPEGIPA